MIESQQKGIDASGPQRAVNILSKMIRGYRLSQLIYVAAALGIADHLAKEPRTPEALAEIVGAQPRNLSRVLRTLATQGIFKQRDDGRYELTPLAEPLQAEAPNSMRDLALMVCDEAFWRPCGQLLHTVRTGQVGFEHAFGVDFWTYLAKQREFAAIFDRSMTKRSQRELAAVLEAYDFSPLGTIVDVGGGEGTLLLSILKKHPQTQGIVFDQPVTIQRARNAINQAALADRCQAVGGDFFKAVPGGGDAYVLQTILHDWDDERAVTILKTCRRAMRNDAKLLIIDLVIPDAGDASREKFEDIVMMVMFDGMERTVEEFSALFQASGFTLTNVIRTPIRCIIEGRPV